MKRHFKGSAAIVGPVKAGTKTKILIDRLKPGDIALINHLDLDELAAVSLRDRKVCAVINVEASSSGRYPNKGPKILSDAKILHLDLAGAVLMDQIAEGDMLTLRNNEIWRGQELLATARVVDEELITKQMTAAELNLDTLLDAFVQNTLEYALKEKELILGGMNMPHLRTFFTGKHTVIVVRGQSYREDLQAIKNYIDEVKPVLVGVDGGADALLEFGYVPDLVVGDMDSVSDLALRKAKERVVHAYTDGRAPGMARIEQLELTATVMKAPGTSEDIALLLAFENGARLIAAIGTHTSMIDFLEKGRKGMASTFLVRLKVGNRLVDARGVSQLYRGSVSGRSLVLLTLAASIPVFALAAANPTVRHLFRLIALRLRLAL
ncbi:MAG: putative cytokinetic ring protein SteA [Firmicutes bacterium]|nr:putative cytokinetic ring protein SteA [Bacillota bacterium]